MLRMAVGHSDALESEEAVEDVLRQCAETLEGMKPTAGLLFSTHEAEPAPIVAGVREMHPQIDIVGSSSAAELSSVLGFQEGSVTLALFASDTVQMSGGLGTGIADDPEGAAREALREASPRSEAEPRLCLTAPAPHQEPLRVLHELRSELGDHVPVLGGVSSATFDDPGSAWQFCNDRFVHDGIPVLLFSGELAVSYGVDNGWRPVGKPARVTRSAGGIVHEIDGRPALEFYERYLGAGAGPSPANPLAVFEEGADDFYLRAAATHNPETGSIVVFGGPPEDATVQLAVAMTDEIFEGTRSAVRKAVEHFPADATPEAAVVFSCMVRKAVLGSQTATETEITRDELAANLPLCGFYSYGEIAPLESGSTQLHNETIVAVLLGTP
jgi:hypothetical protein